MTANGRRPSHGVHRDRVEGSLAESAAAGPGWRPLLALGALCGGLLAQGTGVLLAPDIAASLGRSTPTVGHLLGLWSLGVVLGVPFAMRSVRSSRRVRDCGYGGTVVALG